MARRVATTATMLALLGASMVGVAGSGPAAQAVITCTSSGHSDDFPQSTPPSPLPAGWTKKSVNDPAQPAPNWSLDAHPGCMRLSVPSTATFDSWTGFDNAVHLQRSNMGTNSWSIETRLELVTATGSTPTFHTGLSVRFGASDVIFYGLFKDPSFPEPVIRADRSGASPVFGVVKRNWYGPTSVSLQIQKVGDVYSFLHRDDTQDEWIFDGAYRATSAVANVGLVTKTWGPNGTAVVTDFDYFDLRTGPAASTDCLNQQGVDAGARSDANDWGAVWRYERPAQGPRTWLNATPPNPGKHGLNFNTARWSCHRMYLPPTGTYDFWGGGVNVDATPKRLRTDLGSGAWTIETELNLGMSHSHTSGGSRSHVGIIVRFGQYDALIWGLLDTGSGHRLEVNRTNGLGTIGSTPTWTPGARVYLRISRSTAGLYTFSYSANGTSWTTQGTYSTGTTVEAAGIVAKTWGSATTAVIADFNYFDVTREPTPPGATCLGVGSTDDFDELTLDGSWTALNAPGPFGTSPIAVQASDADCAVFDMPATGVWNEWDGGGGGPTISAAPQLYRTDMGVADWTVETKLLRIATPSSGFHAGLLVRLNATDKFLFGPVTDGALQLHRTTAAPPTFPTDSAAYSQPVVYLRAQRQGASITFSYRAPGDLTWTTVATKSYSGSVQGVGAFAKTFGSATHVVVAFDYFDVTQGDDVESTTINAHWVPFVPSTGPTWSASTNPGVIRSVVPALVSGAPKVFDHNATTDHAPQLRRAVPPENWAMETKATLVANPGSSLHSGLMIRFSQFSILKWGFFAPAAGGTGTDLRASLTGQPGIDIDSDAAAVWLRIEKIGNRYLFFHRDAATDPWTYDGTSRAITATPASVGFINSTQASRSVTVDFDEFRITRLHGN